MDDEKYSTRDENRNNKQILDSRDGSLYDDFENLLGVAEKIQEKANSAERSLRSWYILSSTALVSVIGSYFLVMNMGMITPLFRVLFITISILSSSFLIYFYLWTIRPAQRDIQKERKALERIVHLLRETGESIALQESWSVLKRAEFEIRLSRFEIGGEQTSQKKDKEAVLSSMIDAKTANGKNKA